MSSIKIPYLRRELIDLSVAEVILAIRARYITALGQDESCFIRNHQLMVDRGSHHGEFNIRELTSKERGHIQALDELFEYFTSS